MRSGTVAAGFAALTSLGLGVLAAGLMIAGEHRWDGAIAQKLGHGQGIHQGDFLALLPIVGSIVLAGWCWARRP